MLPEIIIYQQNYKYFSSVFLQAAKQGQEDVIQKHVSQPTFKPNETDDDGHTALHYAAKFNHLKILKLLLEAKASELVHTHSQMRDSNI